MLASIYNGLDTCIDTLALGVLAACCFHFQRVKTSKGILILSAIALTVSLFWVRQHTKLCLLIGHSFIDLLSSALILCLAQQETTYFKRFPECNWLRTLGLWSYSFYLWHYPIINWLHQTKIPKIGIIASTFFLSLLMAKISYQWIERRFWKPFASRTQRLSS